MLKIYLDLLNSYLSKKDINFENDVPLEKPTNTADDRELIWKIIRRNRENLIMTTDRKI